MPPVATSAPPGVPRSWMIAHGQLEPETATAALSERRKDALLHFQARYRFESTYYRPFAPFSVEIVADE